MKNIKGIILFSLCFIFVSFCNCTVRAGEEKVVYLTFDDGPSPSNTNKILDVLERNKVNASFFVVGKNVSIYPDIIKRMDRDNMDIYPHCNNHTYRELYQSNLNYFDDLKECKNSINRVLEKEKSYRFVRMPGGSDNQVGDSEVISTIRRDLISNGINYIDWNVDSGDTTAVRVSTNKIKENMNTDGYKYKVEVVLMHDLENKNTTTEALESIINEYKVLGYRFKTLNQMEPWEFEYLKNIRVVNR